jgi:DNA-binding beta-propeller fold protein YncE
MQRSTLVLPWISVALIVLANSLTLQQASAADTIRAPRFEVDPLWPKPLPNHWLLGSAIGVGVDSRDHVYVLHRRESINPDILSDADEGSENRSCCIAAPYVLEFDPRGNLTGHWGGSGEGYTWPVSSHGLSVDHQGNIWIGGNGARDSHILKFTRTGTFVAQFGEPGQEPNSNARNHFGGVAKVAFDVAANEAYLADGYGNKRVAIVDADTGEFKRLWGAYGNAPDDADSGPYDPFAPKALQFRNPVHCAEPTLDGQVYVCDRTNNRIQVFENDGTYVDELLIAPETRGGGSVWDIAFSRDPQQKFMYVADGRNMKIHIVDRLALRVLTSFGDGGRQPGQFIAVHSIATDSQGNLYTTETYDGKRVQKFIYKGLAAVDKTDQGTPWPRQ